MMNPRQVQAVRGDTLHFTDGTKHQVAGNAAVTISGEEATFDCVVAGDLVQVDGNPAVKLVITRTSREPVAHRTVEVTPTESWQTAPEEYVAPTTTLEPVHHTTHRKKKH